MLSVILCWKSMPTRNRDVVSAAFTSVDTGPRGSITPISYRVECGVCSMLKKVSVFIKYHYFFSL
jgi:hypothetical protein